jgi:adenylylsulfate kinase-like enzyme
VTSTDLDAVLLTGVYGSGKTTVTEEIAQVLQERGVPYGAIDLDWLSWFDVGLDDDDAERTVMLRNLGAVARTYVDVGVVRLVLALSVGSAQELAAIRGAVPCHVWAVRLVTDIDTIERRCAPDPTVARATDLAWARRWLEEGTGEGLEDLAVRNDRPVREVASEVLEGVGW